MQPLDKNVHGALCCAFCGMFSMDLLISARDMLTSLGPDHTAVEKASALTGGDEGNCITYSIVNPSFNSMNTKRNKACVDNLWGMHVIHYLVISIFADGINFFGISFHLVNQIFLLGQNFTKECRYSP